MHLYFILQHPASYLVRDKPIAIFEFDQAKGGGMSSADQYKYAYNNGYSGALAWAYDSHWNIETHGVSAIRHYNDQSKGGNVAINLN